MSTKKDHQRIVDILIEQALHHNDAASIDEEMKKRFKFYANEVLEHEDDPFDCSDEERFQDFLIYEEEVRKG